MLKLLRDRSPLPTLGRGGTGDLRRFTQQPVADLTHFAEQVRHRAHASAAEREQARRALAQFDQEYFTGAWRSLLDTVDPRTQLRAVSLHGVQ
ncbi:MAG: hypothetical protein ACRDTT_11020 [Pseudonocardiaceae bacterium]